jgi:ureidoglycolate amidohydrolase
MFPAPYNVRIWLVPAYADHSILLLLYRYIKGIMKQLGLVVREDAVGNIFGRW